MYLNIPRLTALPNWIQFLLGTYQIVINIPEKHCVLKFFVLTKGFQRNADDLLHIHNF